MKQLYKFSIYEWIDVSSDSDPCQWAGVKCDQKHGNDVVELHLSGFGYYGYHSVWQSVCKLPALKFLDLSNNSLSTPFYEDIRSCTSLVALNVSSNHMSGSLPSLHPLQNLQILDMSYNNLQGGFGTQIQNLTQLRLLFLNYNNFSGWVTFEGLKLEHVDLSYNRLIGVFPAGLNNCTNLTFLDLSGNSLSGSIPDSIRRLVKLETLVLSSNNFSGSIPKALSALTNLSLFEVGQNKLSGTIPGELSLITGLVSLDLSDNELTGSIPPQLFSLRNLLVLDLTFNSLTGGIPQNFSRSLFRLRIGNNHLNGTFPSTISNAPSLTYLEMNNNFLNGPIPEQLASCTELQLLDLGHNKLTSPLTSVLPKLLQLRYLNLANNKFDGSIPDELSNLQNLTYVDLSGNLLSGSISAKMFKLKQLQNLRLHNNRLTGIIPLTIQDGSESLLELQLGSNNLTGTIPSEIGNFSMLRFALNLSHNSLEGRIPISLSSLIALEILDFSNNRLTGVIPESLSSMISLTILDLSYNNLTGSIPSLLNGTKNLQLKTTGNPNLSRDQSVSSTRKGNTLTKVLGAEAAISVFILCCLLLGFHWIRILDRQGVSLSQATRKILEKVEHPRISYEELVTATNTFSESNLLATSSIGSVYKGILTDGTQIAVKVLNLMNEDSDKLFKAECKVLQKVRHRNLARIITTCSNLQFKALIFEFFSNGSLEKHLYQNRGHVFDSGLKELLNIAIDIAHAIEYLHHDCYVQIVHCDIKPDNVLLDTNMTAHLIDFGIARLMGRSSVDSLASTMDLKGSVGYIAPEYGLSGMVSPRGDVYSYGILLLEMLTRKRPTDSTFEGGLNLHKWVESSFPGRAVEVVDKSLLGEGFDKETEECLISLIRIGLLCSRDSPQARPTMRDVSSLLKNIEENWTRGPRSSIKLKPSISNLLCKKDTTIDYVEPSDTQSSTY
ncbi:hypothetical protein KI387_035446 [Taxus chinensis]|uniref:non-specific serine/threonine protein kinase n=1 Tax=Taxus chinensis TaxID=29808 RepID=A0AA38KZS3_TAXCH|nr:hypothetical protein KI387_035446 [Taxus chinensis]